MKKITIKRGDRYFDSNGVIHVVIYAKPIYPLVLEIDSEIIKLMPLKKNSRIDVWDVEDFKNQVKLLRYINIVHPPITRENVSEHLLEFQFNILGKTMSDTIQETSWKTSWKLSDVQKKMFKIYAIKVLKKVFKFNNLKAQVTYDFFNEEFGLDVITS